MSYIEVSPSAPASGTTFTPVGNVAASNVQAAIAEVDSEKVAKAGDTMSGALTVGGSVQASTFLSTSAGTLQYGGAAPTGVFSDNTNVALRSFSTGGNVYLQSVNGGDTYAQFSGSAIALNKNVTITPGTLNVASAAAAASVTILKNTNSAAGDRVLDIWGGAGTAVNDTTSYLTAFFDGAGSNVGGIKRNGPGTISLITTSDERLKIDRGVSTRGMDDINRIVVHDFSFKSTPDQTTQGFFAQQLYEIYPEAVGVGGDDPVKQPWGVDNGRLTPLLVRAAQQLQEQLAAALARIEALEAK